MCHTVCTRMCVCVCVCVCMSPYSTVLETVLGARACVYAYVLCVPHRQLCAAKAQTVHDVVDRKLSTTSWRSPRPV